MNVTSFTSSSKFLSVRILNADTRTPLYSVIHEMKNYIVANAGTDYVVEHATDHAAKEFYFRVKIDGNTAGLRRTTSKISVREGFRICDNEGRIVGHKVFRVDIPEIVEPGSAKANVREAGVIEVKAYTTRERSGKVFKKLISTFPEDKENLQEKATKGPEKKAGPVPITVAGAVTLHGTAKAHKGTTKEPDVCIGIVQIIPTTAFALQVQGEREKYILYTVYCILSMNE